MPPGLVALAVGALGALGTVGAAWIAGSFRSKTTEKQSSLANTREDLRLAHRQIRILKGQLVSCLKYKVEQSEDDDGASLEQIIEIVEMGLQKPKRHD